MKIELGESASWMTPRQRYHAEHDVQQMLEVLLPRVHRYQQIERNSYSGRVLKAGPNDVDTFYLNSAQFYYLVENNMLLTIHDMPADIYATEGTKLKFSEKAYQFLKPERESNEI